VTALAPTATLAEIGSTALFIDPAVASRRALIENLWAVIETGSRQLAILTTFNPEGPFDVNFNRQA
jgi:hypothetical protein